MSRKPGRERRALVCAALGVLAFAGCLSYAQDNTTPQALPVPLQVSSTTKIDVLGSAKPGDGSNTDKAWQSFLQGLLQPKPIVPPGPPNPIPLPLPPVPLGPAAGIPGGLQGLLNGVLGGNAAGAAVSVVTGTSGAGTSGGIPGGLQGLLNGILNGNAAGGAVGGAVSGVLAGLPAGLASQIQGLLNGTGGLVGQIQGILNGVLNPGALTGTTGGVPGLPWSGMFGGIAGNGNILQLDAVVELQSQTTVDLSSLGANTPQLPAPTLTLRGDVVITGSNLPLMPSFDRTQPHLDANGALLVVKGASVYGIGLLFGLGPQDWTGLKKLDQAPLPHLKKVLADGGKPLTAAQEAALHIDLEEQLVDSAGSLAAAPGSPDSALDFTRKLFSLWQATLGDDPGFLSRLQSVLSADQLVLLESTPVLLCAGKPRPVPTIAFTSLSITPNPAVVGQPVTFTVVVEGIGVKVAWDFGDGTTDSSNSLSVTHTYSTAGTFGVTVTGSNANKSITFATCLLVLAADGQPPPDSGAGVNGLAMVVNMLHALLKLDPSALSMFTMSGVLPNGPAALAGAKVDITIGGQTVSFTLDKKGNGSTQGSSVQLKARAIHAAKGAQTTGGTNVSFRAKLALSKLPSSLLDAGSAARRVKKTVNLPIAIQLNDQFYSTTLAGKFVSNGKNARLTK